MKPRIGDKMKIPGGNEFHPETGHVGKIVWISEDETTLAIECEKKHNHKTSTFMVKINRDK